MEESLTERERQEARESFRKLVEKNNYGELDLKNLNIVVVFLALLLTNKIVLKNTIIITLKNTIKVVLKKLCS